MLLPYLPIVLRPTTCSGSKQNPKAQTPLNPKPGEEIASGRLLVICSFWDAAAFPLI
jgi:hypothetical protein